MRSGRTRVAEFLVEGIELRRAPQLVLSIADLRVVAADHEPPEERRQILAVRFERAVAVFLGGFVLAPADRRFLDDVDHHAVDVRHLSGEPLDLTLDRFDVRRRLQRLPHGRFVLIERLRCRLRLADVPQLARHAGVEVRNPRDAHAVEATRLAVRARVVPRRRVHEAKLEFDLRRLPNVLAIVRDTLCVHGEPHLEVGGHHRPRLVPVTKDLLFQLDARLRRGVPRRLAGLVGAIFRRLLRSREPRRERLPKTEHLARVVERAADRERARIFDRDDALHVCEIVFRAAPHESFVRTPRHRAHVRELRGDVRRLRHAGRGGGAHAFEHDCGRKRVARRLILDRSPDDCVIDVGCGVLRLHRRNRIHRGRRLIHALFRSWRIASATSAGRTSLFMASRSARDTPSRRMYERTPVDALPANSR